MDTLKKGDISEQEFVLWAMKNGFEVAKPISSHLKYDFLLFYNKTWQKVQVKTACIRTFDGGRNKYISASTGCRLRTNVKRGYNDEEVDYFFIVFGCRFWLIPIELHNTLEIHLERVSELLNRRGRPLEDFSQYEVTLNGSQA